MSFCIIIMKFMIKTQNSEMAFDLRQEEIESLVWTAFQYAAGNQQYQEETQPEEEVRGYEEKEGYIEDRVAGVIREEVEDSGMLEGQNDLEETAGLSGDSDGVSGQEQQGQPPLDPAQGIQEQASYNPQVTQKIRKREYKGFLLIKCQHCGKLKGFCPKTPIQTFLCECGGQTPIQNMVQATASCKCGKNWVYRTNADDRTIEINCIKCGGPIDLVWNVRKGRYVTLQDWA